jgi:hypothetical protein
VGGVRRPVSRRVKRTSYDRSSIVCRALVVPEGSFGMLASVTEPIEKGPEVADTTEGSSLKVLTLRITEPSLRSVRELQPATARARIRGRRTVTLRVMVGSAPVKA